MIILLIPLAGSAQEVVISGFPVGVAGSVGDSFFEPYYPQLQTIADTLRQYPLLHAIVTGSADGETFRVNNDAQNPGLALGRAHVLKSLLLEKFGVDSTQIVVQTEDVSQKGAEFRRATVRIVWDMNDIKTRLDNLANREPVVQQPITEVREINHFMPENMGLQLGAGLSSSPFGGVPVVSAALVWDDKIYVEGIVGHSFWNGSFDFATVTLDTRRRLAAGAVSYFPFDKTRIGFLAGWMRVEEMAQRYYQYVKMSEGPIFGATWYPFRFATLTAFYNPVRERIVGDPVREHRANQLSLLARFHVQFGGRK